MAGGLQELELTLNAYGQKYGMGLMTEPRRSHWEMIAFRSRLLRNGKMGNATQDKGLGFALPLPLPFKIGHASSALGGTIISISRDATHVWALLRYRP